MAFAFEKLFVYQKAVDFADACYSLTKGIPRGYFFLANHLNRAALSIAGCTLDPPMSLRDVNCHIGSSRQGQVGGLLAAHDTLGTAVTTDDKDYAYFYDTNGNVGQVIDVTASVLQPATFAAKYEYDPYGQSLLDPSNAAVSGPYAATNPFRFSTKYCDSELASGVATSW